MSRQGAFATELERESRLADTRRTLDVQVADVPPGESEIDSSLPQVRLHVRGCLIRHPVFITVRPLVQRQQPRRSSRPTGSNGGMLIAPPLHILAAVDDNSL